MSFYEEMFSDDPEENLCMENELLKLKLQAQFGASIGTGEGLPPGVENEFLKSVFAFQLSHGTRNSIRVMEFLGSPIFPKESDLDELNLKKEFGRLTELMVNKSIAIDFIRPREDRFKYKFITEELFEHKMDGGGFPGMTCNFIYEEFHPDHEMDIESRAKDFLRDWFKKEFNEYSLELSSVFVLADGRSLSRDEVLVKIQHVFDSYTSFVKAKMAIHEVKFQWNDETQTGFGHAEGAVKYDAKLITGETINFEGPFKLYLSNEDGWWGVFYFVFPGFEW